MGATLTIAIRNLLQARRRTFLLATALAGVTALLVLMLALSQGLNDTMLRNATAISSGHVNVAGFYKNKPTDSYPLITGVADLRALVEQNTPGLDYIVVRDRAWAKVISERQSLFVSPTGIDIASEPQLGQVIQLAPESAYRDGGRDEVLGRIERLSEPHTALIFAAQARRLGVTVGDYLTITAPTGSGRTNTIDVVVAAVAKDFGFYSNWSLFVPSSSIQELYQLAPDTSSAIQIYLKDPARAEQVLGHLREVLAQHGHKLMDHESTAFWMKFERVAGEDWTGQKLDLTIWSDEISFLKWISTALDVLAVTLVGILMVIIGVGIMNSMWIAVRERTTEVGMVRAIGMSRWRVLKMFLAEALLLGIFATLLGAGLGAGIAAAVDAAHYQVPFAALEAILMTDVLHLAVRPLEVLHVVWIFTALTGLSALWPALRASRLQPVVAIQRAG